MSLIAKKPGAAAPTKVIKSGGFKLVPYFAAASLVMFMLVAFALSYFENGQQAFFKQVQDEERTFFDNAQKAQGQFFKKVQDDFVAQQEKASLRDVENLVEASNVNLTHVFANALWNNDFAPFVQRAQSISPDACRVIADVKDEKTGKMTQPPEKKACYKDIGKKIMALKGFNELNAKVFSFMKKSTVRKVKVYDLRGLTIYSSEHAQIGEDKSTNNGWKAAANGTISSELSHRDKFSAFEEVVENIDVVSSYLPAYQPGTDKIVGVFEVYNDGTVWINQVKETSANIKKAAAANQAQVDKAIADSRAKAEQTAAAKQAEVEADGTRNQIIVLGMMVLLFGALFLIVLRANRIIVTQEKERENAQHQLAQSEKMASLGLMVAGVAHQLNTPLAFSHSNISMAMEVLKSYELPLKVAGTFSRLVNNANADSITINVAGVKDQVATIDPDSLDTSMPVAMLEDTLKGVDQMRELVDNLRDFTRLDRSKTGAIDLNKGLHNVVYIAKSVIPTHIEVVEEYGQIPTTQGNMSQLNQVFLNLINNAAHAIKGEGRITIKTSTEGNRLRVDVSDTGSGIPADVLPRIWDTYFTTKPEGEGTGLGLTIAKNIVTEHGGEIAVTSTEIGKGTTFTIHLPVVS